MDTLNFLTLRTTAAVVVIYANLKTTNKSIPTMNSLQAGKKNKKSHYHLSGCG
jgi:hypothetical protein